MPGRDVIVIGASAGGVEALMKLLSALPAKLSAALFVVVHIPAQTTSHLPQILGRVGPLAAIHPTDGMTIEPGKVYVAPPDHHLLVERGYIRIVRGPKENRHRPAIDVLFRSAARAYGPRTIGVILTGTLDDGTAGLLAIKRQGGRAVVQDPLDALYPGMPQSALNNVKVDYKVPLAQLAPLLAQLVGEQASEEGVPAVSEDMQKETELAEMKPSALHSDKHPGTPSAFSCPECGGVLWELHDEELLRFRCRVGHAFSTESVLAEQSDALEAALWSALKTLEENVSLTRRLTQQARSRNQSWLVNRFEAKASEAIQRAELIRSILLKDSNEAIQAMEATDEANSSETSSLPLTDSA